MATKYKSQVTNKWIGSSYKGTVRHQDARTTEMGQIVSALRNDLTPAMNNWGEKHIEKKQTEAGAKMDELYAKGWKTKDIQKAILNDEIPELSNHYATSVVDTHSGRFEAAKTIRQIEANLDAYDYKDGTKTIEEFWKQYLPNFNEASTQFTVGFSAVFNEFAANAKIADAQKRAEHAHTVKVDKAIGFMDTTTTVEDIKNGNYFKKLMTLNTEMPIDGTGKAYFFDTNELNEEIALGHARWLIDTATSEDQLDKAIILLSQDRGKGKGKNELGSLANTYSKESRELILKLNNKRLRIQNDDRQKKDDLEKEDVSGLLTTLMTDVDEVIAGETKTRKRTHTENLEILEKLAAYGNPSYINAYEKLIDVNAWKEADPAVFNALISSIRDGDFEDLGDVLDAMVELSINPDDWKAGLVYFKEFDDDRKKGNKPIYQMNETYIDGLRVNLTAVKGNFMKKGANDMWEEDPNSGVALGNAQYYMEKQIVDFEKRFKDKEGREPTFQERKDFLNNLQAVAVEHFNKDNLSPALKSYTEYEEEVLANKELEKQKVIDLEAKNKSYKDANITQMIESVTDALDINQKDLKLLIPEFDDDIFFSDTDWFDTDATDEREFNEKKIVPILTDQLEKFMGDFKWTENMMAIMQEDDYKAFRDNIIDTLSGFGIGGININTVEKALKAIAKRNINK